MPFDSEFSAKCGALRAAAKQLRKASVAAAQADTEQHLTEGMTVMADPSSLRMSLGEARAGKAITLCTFSRSELLSVLYIRRHAEFQCHPSCNSSECMYGPGDCVHLDLHRLRIGKTEMSEDAVKRALQQLESGLLSRNTTVLGIRLGLAPLYITHLNIAQNGIVCRGMMKIAKALSGMRRLQFLDVSSNKLGYEGWRAVGEVLASSKYLTELDMSGNLIGHSNAKPNAVPSPTSPGRGSAVALKEQTDPDEDQIPDVACKDIDMFVSGLAACKKMTRFSCSSCGLSADQISLIFAAACVSATLRNLDVSGNRILEAAKSTRDAGADLSAAGEGKKSKTAREAQALILILRQAAIFAQLEQLGIALGMFITLKDPSEDRQGVLKMQSILEIRAIDADMQAARDSFWKGVLAAVSGRICTLGEVDLTANCLGPADEDAVLAILNKFAVDGVARLSVGHAFLKHPSIAAKVVESLTRSCATRHLHALNLTGTLIGNDGAASLSQALGHRAVGWPHELQLSKCNISDAGCVVLFDALLQSIRRNDVPIGIINLSSNMITDEAMAAIAPMIINFVEKHVAGWAKIVGNWLRQTNFPNGSQAIDQMRFSYFSIRELNFEGNIISEIGLRNLISGFLCKSILKFRTAAAVSLVQDEGIPLVQFVKCLDLLKFKPLLQILRIGGNVCSAPSTRRVVHVCGADPVFQQECSSAALRSLPVVQSIQEQILSALLDNHRSMLTSKNDAATQIRF